MAGTSKPSYPWEDFHMDAIEKFCNDDDFESDDSWERTSPEPVSHAQSSSLNSGRGNQHGRGISPLHSHTLQAAIQTLPLPSNHTAHCDNPSFFPAKFTIHPGFDCEAAAKQFLQDIKAAGLTQQAQTHNKSLFGSPWSMGSAGQSPLGPG